MAVGGNDGPITLRFFSALSGLAPGDEAADASGLLARAKSASGSFLFAASLSAIFQVKSGGYGK